MPSERASSPSLFVTPNYEEKTPIFAACSTPFNSDNSFSQSFTKTATRNPFHDPLSLKRKSEYSLSYPTKRPRTSPTTSSPATPAHFVPSSTPATLSYIERTPSALNSKRTPSASSLPGTSTSKTRTQNSYGKWPSPSNFTLKR